MTVTIPRYFVEIRDDQENVQRFEPLLSTLFGELGLLNIPFPTGVFSIEDTDDVLRELVNSGKWELPILNNRHIVSIDAPIHPADYTAHVHDGSQVSQSTAVADRLINSAALRPLVEGCDRTVNIVIADNGLTEAFAAKSGWNNDHFSAEVNGAPTTLEPSVVQAAAKHANMIAWVARRYNKHAVIWDMPILPQRIDDIPSYTSVATAHFEALLQRVRADKMEEKDESWVVVCAWSLVSTEYEAGLLNYHDDRRHQLSLKVLEMVDEGIDVVFAAGNLGQFYPAQGAGHYDIGPHRSIFGANGLPEVLTVGAVSPTGGWIGAASQGVEGRYLRIVKPSADEDEAEDPGPRKPDLCAPSWFFDQADPALAVTGTSGACAVAAGVVAAVRRAVGPSTLSPAELIDLMRETASGRVTVDPHARDSAESWRLGNGIIDCAALVAGLP